MNLNDEILNILEKAKNEIISNIQGSGISASGRTEKALKVVERNGHIMFIKGEGNVAPMTTLEVGREAGKVPYNFTEIIMEWMKDKGMTPDKKIAGAIAWGKIRNEGTKRHSQPREDIYTPVVNSVIQKIETDFVKSAINTILGR